MCQNSKGNPSSESSDDNLPPIRPTSNAILLPRATTSRYRKMPLQSQTPRNPFLSYHQATFAPPFTSCVSTGCVAVHRQLIYVLTRTRLQLGTKKAQAANLETDLREARLQLEEQKKCNNQYKFDLASSHTSHLAAVEKYNDLVKQSKEHCTACLASSRKNKEEKHRLQVELDAIKVQLAVANGQNVEYLATQQRPITEVGTTTKAQPFEHRPILDLAIQDQTIATQIPPLCEPARSDTAPKTSKSPQLSAIKAQLAVANGQNEEYLATQQRPITEVGTTTKAQHFEHEPISDLAIQDQTIATQIPPLCEPARSDTAPKTGKSPQLGAIKAAANGQNSEYLATKKRSITEVDTTTKPRLSKRSDIRIDRKQALITEFRDVIYTALKTNTSPHMNLTGIYDYLRKRGHTLTIYTKGVVREALKKNKHIFVRTESDWGSDKGGLWSLTETAWSEGLD